MKFPPLGEGRGGCGRINFALMPGSDVRNKAPTLKIKILTVLRNIVQSLTGAQEPRVRSCINYRLSSPAQPPALPIFQILRSLNKFGFNETLENISFGFSFSVLFR